MYPGLVNPGVQQQQQHQGQVGGIRRDVSNEGEDRIVGGVEATPHEFPFVVALTIDNKYFCGGSIIGM